MIVSDSRYIDSTVEIVTDDRGTHQSVSVPAPVDQVVTFTYYLVEDDDTIDFIAYQFYNDGRLWWVIADANPEILDWKTLSIGTVLRIPSA